MRLSRFLSAVLFITFLSCIYVRQQTEVFCLGYSGQKTLSRFNDLLDKNSILRYNLKKNTSLISMGSKVSESKDFQMPDNYLLVKLTSPKEELSPDNRYQGKRQNLVSRFFSVKRVAEAKTIGPSVP
jgi:hypothetical protein